MENLSKERVKTNIMRRLREFQPDLPDPIKIVITKWNGNENTLGSYSYQTLKSISNWGGSWESGQIRGGWACPICWGGQK